MNSFRQAASLATLTVLATASLAALIILATASDAAAWKFEEFMNPQGDQGRGIVQPASNRPGIALAFGCDRDRWRQVALIPGQESPLRLSKGGAVSLGFAKTALHTDGKWRVRNLAEGRRLYFAPAPSQLMGRLYREEQRDPKAVLYVQVRPEKKSPIVLEFPVAGLREALTKHLWKECKLDVYFGEPE